MGAHMHQRALQEQTAATSCGTPLWCGHDTHSRSMNVLRTRTSHQLRANAKLLTTQPPGDIVSAASAYVTLKIRGDQLCLSVKGRRKVSIWSWGDGSLGKGTCSTGMET